MSGGFSTARLDRMRGVMAGHVERGALPGVVTLVSRRGETHVEAIGSMAVGGAPIRRDAVFRIASMTKPVTAVAVMILVEECALRLDDPVDPLLPELADRRVLVRPDSPLDDTVPAHRPITPRDLLTFRAGFGMVLNEGAPYPIQRAMDEAGIAPGPNPPACPPDELMRRLGALPLVHQPGRKWMYHTGSDVLGVLVARASGRPLEDFLRERVFDPLRMRDTGFHVPPEKLDRLPTGYRPDPGTGGIRVHDDPRGSRWGRPPVFASGGSGLVSTADDYLAFCRMLLDKGRYDGGRILSRPSVDLMTTDHLTPEQRRGADVLLEDNSGWGFGLGVTTRRDGLSSTPGRFGWFGGAGTSAYSDPAEDMVGILMTQLSLDAPASREVFSDFWTSAYQAIDD